MLKNLVTLLLCWVSYNVFSGIENGKRYNYTC